MEKDPPPPDAAPGLVGGVGVGLRTLVTACCGSEADAVAGPVTAVAGAEFEGLAGRFLPGRKGINPVLSSETEESVAQVELVAQVSGD
jgi:hypothetical protein